MGRRALPSKLLAHYTMAVQPSVDAHHHAYPHSNCTALCTNRVVDKTCARCMYHLPPPRWYQQSEVPPEVPKPGTMVHSHPPRHLTKAFRVPWRG